MLTTLLLLLACGDSTTADSDSGTPDSGVADADTDTDTQPSTTATLSGTIRRTVDPVNGGTGRIYVALFDRDPVWEVATAEVVGQVVVEDVDMSGAAQARYELADLPPRSQPYYVFAFLDDNANASQLEPVPDAGDLLTMDFLAAPQVTVDRVGTVVQDLELNTVMPF